MGAKALEFIGSNWFFIIIAINVVIYTYEEMSRRNNEEKVAIAKHLIAISIDALVSEAETKFANNEKSGQLKRSYVIQTVFEKYPVLNNIIEQEALIDWIDKLIEESVSRLRLTVSEFERK